MNDECCFQVRLTDEVIIKHQLKRQNVGNELDSDFCLINRTRYVTLPDAPSNEL